jgi:ankyrin repeat protein
MNVLHLAALSKNRKFVEYFLHQEVLSTDCLDLDGNTPLLLACREGAEDIAVILLHFGANPFVVNKVSLFVLLISKPCNFIRLLLVYDLVW